MLYSLYPINKAHQLPFCDTSLQSHALLELIYTGVWGPGTYTGIDESCYYLKFVYHHTKYIWFYPMVKSLVFLSFFHNSKNLLKHDFKPKSKHIILTMVMNLLP